MVRCLEAVKSLSRKQECALLNAVAVTVVAMTVVVTAVAMTVVAGEVEVTEVEVEVVEVVARPVWISNAAVAVVAVIAGTIIPAAVPVPAPALVGAVKKKNIKVPCSVSFFLLIARNLYIIIVALTLKCTAILVQKTCSKLFTIKPIKLGLCTIHVL